VSTISAVDGTFSLNLDLVPQSATIPLAIQIGRFRKWTTIPVTCSPNPQRVTTAMATWLPGATVAGVADVPKLLVSAGNSDHLDVVLRDLGITEYTCVEGRSGAPNTASATCPLTAASPYIADVIQNGTIDNYHMAFLSCAPKSYNWAITTHGNNQTTLTNNLSGWVQNSYGRLMVTDTSYDYVAQSFPGDITWGGPGGTPQPPDGANIGCAPGTNPHSVPYTINVDEPQLAQWLAVVGHPAPVTVDGFYEPWSVMGSLPASTQRIADGTMSLDPTIVGTTCSPTQQQMDVPLTARFEVPTCGRVIYSSYHTDAAGAATTTANEKIMEYLLFEAAFCH
jgi:hypothetical protein